MRQLGYAFVVLALVGCTSPHASDDPGGNNGAADTVAPFGWALVTFETAADNDYFSYCYWATREPMPKGVATHFVNEQTGDRVDLPTWDEGIVSWSDPPGRYSVEVEGFDVHPEGHPTDPAELDLPLHTGETGTPFTFVAVWGTCPE
jgi:hypothetical protein